MSATHDTSHDHNHHDDHDEGIPHISLKGYVIGFLLSVVLTAIPFWLVMDSVLKSTDLTAAIILAFAAIQIVVHMVFFLHLDAKSEGGWNMLAMIFTAILLVILMAGSLWVMYHMNVNMMPGHADHISEPYSETTPGHNH